MGNISAEVGKESQDVVVDSGITGDNRVTERVTGSVVDAGGVVRSTVDYDKELPDYMGANQRFEIVIADPLTIEVVIQRVLDGESLKQIAKSWKVPTLRFVKWVSDDAVRLASYEGALRIRADELIHETLEIAAGRQIENSEGEMVDVTDVARDKLMVDTNIKLAAMWDRQRYGGEKGLGGAGITIVVNRGRYADEVAINGEAVGDVVGGVVGGLVGSEALNG